MQTRHKKLKWSCHLYDLDGVDDQLPHDESVRKYVMMNRVKRTPSQNYLLHIYNIWPSKGLEYNNVPPPLSSLHIHHWPLNYKTRTKGTLVQELAKSINDILVQYLGTSLPLSRLHIHHWPLNHKTRTKGTLVQELAKSINDILVQYLATSWTCIKNQILILYWYLEVRSLVYTLK